MDFSCNLFTSTFKMSPVAPVICNIVTKQAAKVGVSPAATIATPSEVYPSSSTVSVKKPASTAFGVMMITPAKMQVDRKIVENLIKMKPHCYVDLIFLFLELLFLT